MGALFVVEGVDFGTCLVSLAGIAEGLTIGTLAVPLIITLPILFLSMEPVGSQNETEELMEFYRVHNSSHIGEPSINNEFVQVKNNKKYPYEDKYETSYTIARDLGLYSTLTPIPGGDGNISLFNTILVIVGVSYALGSFYFGPSIINHLTTDSSIDYIKIDFNETTNKTDIIIYYK